MNFQVWQLPVDHRKKMMVRYYHTLGSTNREAVNLARQGAEEWTIIAAAQQTAGKGRYHRQWISPAGAGLWFSVILRPKLDLNLLNIISLTSAVILREFLLKILRESALTKKISVGLKWPNDVLLNKKKIAGLLLESGISAKKLNYVIVGIGINIQQMLKDFPPSLQETAISLKIATAQDWDLTELLKRFLKFYYQQYRAVERSHFKKIIPRYRRYLLFKNKRIRIQLPTKEITGILRDIDEQGYLVLERNSQLTVITSGDIWTTKEVKKR